ncbi:MAG: hypothetical protein LBM73_02025 [Candidatus Nomurabacteria bacterium]|nr:hypothetical protein [Candidatus Nomurabacteria bacterium]
MCFDCSKYSFEVKLDYLEMRATARRAAAEQKANVLKALKAGLVKPEDVSLWLDDDEKAGFTFREL